MAKRRLVVCYDGTWNSADKGGKPTNVVKMVRAVRNRDDEGVSQVTFYDKGVGTAGGTDAIRGGAFGDGLTANVIDGYRFLANNFEPDDEIYIFGFSRGAYTARSLAGLIGLAGLLSPKDLGGGLLAVMEVYRRTDIESPEKRDEIERRCKAGGTARHCPVRIRCVGVWDTVGSLGIPGDYGRRFLAGKYYFHDVELGAHVDMALHAVAIDEKRSAFAPTLWVSKTGAPAFDEQVVEQVWFAGAHSNVGGSYDDSGLSDITFDWMARRVGSTGLALDIPPLAPDGAGAVGIDSRTLMYTGSKWYPYQRVINRELPRGDGVGEWFRTTFPDFDRRNIPPDGLRTVKEALHVSVLERWGLDAVPHDCKAGGPYDKSPYRPVTLAAVVEAHHQGRSMPVVGWDGEIMKAGDVPWPEKA